MMAESCMGRGWDLGRLYRCWEEVRAEGRSLRMNILRESNTWFELLSVSGFTKSDCKVGAFDTRNGRVFRLLCSSTFSHLIQYYARTIASHFIALPAR